MFQLLDYGDSITITPITEDRITLLTPLKGVEDQDNLIIKAAQHLKKQTGYQGGAEISIEKVLPMGGGLGGGSSNAATVLVALNYLWQCGLTPTELAQIGVTLGADVPVFIFGHSAFAEGIGEKLQAVDVPEKWYLVLKPDISISTAAIFQDPGLKRNSEKLPTAYFMAATICTDASYWNGCLCVCRIRHRGGCPRGARSNSHTVIRFCC